MPIIRSTACVAAALTAVAIPLAASAGKFVCPAHGGRAWREVASDHFVITTDLDSRDARALADQLG